jgi:high-affinity Fe2+/Pb2+ permease
MLRFITRQRVLLAVTVVTSMGVGYALAQQPHMDAALRALQNARGELQQAAADKGGHREHAIALVDQAIAQVREGIAFAAHH